jgi:putative flippase GtrA
MRELTRRLSLIDVGRLARFGVVGGASALIQLSMLELFKAAGLPSVPAYASGMAIAVQFNFLLNMMLVWGDRPLIDGRIASQVRRWLTFHACIALSLALNLGTFAIAQTLIADLLAGVVAIATSTLVKFVSLDRLTFRQDAALLATRPPG